MREGKMGLCVSHSHHHCNFSYWLMNFFAGPQMLAAVNSTLKHHPDIIRFTFLKKADTLKQLIRP